jgi:excisionase family DNA binding protein
MREAAGYLSCAYWAIRQLIYAKELIPIPIGRRYCLDRVDLDNWIERKKKAI